MLSGGFTHLLSELSWVQWAQSLILLVALVSVTQMVYNIFLHPLASIPGPKLDTASHIPFQIYQIKGRGSHHIAELHSIYGPVVRYSPNSVSYITASAWKDINGHRMSDGGPLPRSRAMVRDIEQFGAWNLMVADNPDHARQRKQLAPAFTDKALREQEGLITGYIDLLIQRFHETAGTIVDVGTMFNFATFDIVGELAFGQNEFQSLEKMRTHPWVGMIFAMMPSLGIFGAVVTLTPWLVPFMGIFIDKKTKRELDGHPKMTIEFVNKRLAAPPSNKPDFISYIMRETKAGPSSMLENREIYATTASTIIAGSETTATSLTGTVYFLLHNPEKLEKLQTEIRTSFHSGSDITYAATLEKNYLLAVLDEVQRIYPAVPENGNRLVPKGGCMIDGQFIPEGSIIGLTPYAAYRSETNFKDANKFVPERWLGDEKYADDNRDVFQPFGYGPYGCIGMKLAQMEMRTILAKLVWHFDMELVNPTEDWLDQRANIIWQRRPLMVKLSKRADI